VDDDDARSGFFLASPPPLGLGIDSEAYRVPARGVLWTPGAMQLPELCPSWTFRPGPGIERPGNCNACLSEFGLSDPNYHESRRFYDDRVVRQHQSTGTGPLHSPRKALQGEDAARPPYHRSALTILSEPNPPGKGTLLGGI